MNYKSLTALLLIVSMGAVASAASDKKAKKNWRATVVSDIDVADSLRANDKGKEKEKQNHGHKTDKLGPSLNGGLMTLETSPVEKPVTIAPVEGSLVLEQQVQAANTDVTDQVGALPIVGGQGQEPAPEIVVCQGQEPVVAPEPESVEIIETVISVPTPEESFDCIVEMLRKFTAPNQEPCLWMVDVLAADLNNIPQDHQARGVAERIVAFILNQIEVRERVASNAANEAANVGINAQNLAILEQNLLNEAMAQEQVDADLLAINRDIESYIESIKNLLPILDVSQIEIVPLIPATEEISMETYLAGLQLQLLGATMWRDKLLELQNFLTTPPTQDIVL